jgi:adenosine 3'-phospho 5'-phosphosulfate transporter B3
MTSTRETEEETEALLTKKTRTREEDENTSEGETTEMKGRVMTKSKFQTPFAFILLSFLTVLALGLSCVAEEYIIKQIPGFDFFWFLAFSELVVFSALTVLVQLCGWDEEEEKNKNEEEDAKRNKAKSSDVDLREEGKAEDTYESGFWHTKAPKTTLVLGGILIALYTSLGKFAYKYVNYATGTVLKSAKLIPVMFVSVVWLKRRYELIDYVACFLLVAAACEFGLGEQENSDKTENPSENYALGLTLSLITIGIGAFQSNVTDRILRDYGATVGENMLWTNAVGAIFIFFFVVLLEPHAFMFFWDTPLYFMLLTFRSVSFFFGAWLYTIIVKHFGAVPAVAITTTRKLLTVIGSFVFFANDKPFTTTYAIALGLFVLAVGCEYVKHYQKHSSQKHSLKGGRLSGKKAATSTV